MNIYRNFIIIHLLLFSVGLCEISLEQKVKLLTGFRSYYNNLPEQVYISEEGFLQNILQVGDSTYQLLVNLKVSAVENESDTKLLKCTATVEESDPGSVVKVLNYGCEEYEQTETSTGPVDQTPVPLVEVTEPAIERKPIHLDNEVQLNTDVTSGEQFIAIPRDQPSAPCVGCASFVNPQAAGVADLVNLGIRHLDLHQPSVKHTLNTVISVERQVQVVNGIRYILMLLINTDICTDESSENCATTKVCKITVLVKPWIKLPNGAKYRAILGNNCTAEWHYGDDGEVLPELTDNSPITNNNTPDEDIHAKRNSDLQSQPNQERRLTDEEIKSLQEQIIPTASNHVTTPTPTDKQHVFKSESIRQNENVISFTKSQKQEQPSNINPDKRKAIDDLLNFFDLSGYNPVRKSDNTRIKRSYDDDLQVLSLAEDFHGIKKSILNARFVYDMAQAMVDYINEIEMEVKNRVVKNVLKAEEELENNQRFVYVQALITIPCDKVECGPKDTVMQICNGVIDCTNQEFPQILSAFCYNYKKETDPTENIKDVNVSDPLLQMLATQAVQIIETESNSTHALKINKIVAAHTQVSSGTLTKMSIIVESLNCNKNIPISLRVNCTTQEHLGAKVCEIVVLERHWLKEKKISYTCTERPVDMRISKAKPIIKNVTRIDSKVDEMLQEALQYLESKSNRNNKQKIVDITSISSQIIAGFLTKIEFVVGYTNCTDENYSVNNCGLLENEDLRTCKAQIWDRSWIMDGRQVEVKCDEPPKHNEIKKTMNNKKKRSIELPEADVNTIESNNDAYYRKLANESLSKYLKTTHSRQHYKVVRVERVNVRELSGKLIIMDFTISPTTCLLDSDGYVTSTECDVVNPKNISQCYAKILEQLWIEKKQYSVNCNIKQVTEEQKDKQNIKYVMMKENNPNDPKYYELAKESLKIHLDKTSNSSPYELVRIVKANTSQIASGLLTNIDFIVSPKDDIESNDINCNSKILEKLWLGTKAFNVTCETKVESNDLEDDPHNPEYMQMAVESLQKYIKSHPESNLIRVTLVDEVVPHANGKFKIQFMASETEDNEGETLCQAEYSAKISEIEVKCYKVGKILSSISKLKTDDPNDSKYVKLADESFKKYLDRMNISLNYNILNIEKASVVWKSGIKTVIIFVVSLTDLNDSDQQTKRCLSQIMERPWLHTRQVDIHCNLLEDLYRIKRHILNDGIKTQLTSVTLQDPANIQYKRLAEESLKKYVHDIGLEQTLNVHRIERVTTQVVSGLITRIDFIASKKPEENLKNVMIKCSSQIWEHAWLDKKDIEVSCENSTEQINRTQMIGGLTERDPSDPKFKVLAEESLQKYIEQSVQDTGTLTVARVEKVTTQVVEGKLTRIDFIVSVAQDNKLMHCHSEVWERPWLGKTEIQVTCQNENAKLKRDIEITGGLVEQDPNNPKFKMLADESLRKFELKSGLDINTLSVERIDKVTTQVVSGKVTRIDFLITGEEDYGAMNCHSEIWERAWLHRKDINVACQKVTEVVKRDATMGDFKEEDPSDPEFKQLAEESLRKYYLDNGIELYSHNTLIVEKVITKIVSGKLTQINFMVSGAEDEYAMYCYSEVWDRPWLNKKEIDVSCQSGKIVKRTELGGLTQEDPSLPKFKAMAEESLKQYSLNKGIDSFSLRVERIFNVTTQVVAGLLTRIDFIVSGEQYKSAISCHSKIWEQSWLKSREIVVTCQNVTGRVKRNVGKPGGLSEEDPTDPKYKQLAQESLTKYTEDRGIDASSLRIERIDKVTTQVVAGSMTRIDFLVTGGEVAFNCHSEIWERSWLNKKEINVTCQNVNGRVKRNVGKPGGLSEKDPTDPKYKQLAQESLTKYTEDRGIDASSLRIERIDKVTTQIVAGSMTRIDFLVTGGEVAFNCHSEIWERSWLNKKEINVTCQNVNGRVKRNVGKPGGLSEEDPTDPKYKQLAQESLTKYTEDRGIDASSLRIERIDKVTTQVVAGSMTRIDFLVTGGEVAFNCHSEIWERSWLNKKEINVICQNVNGRVKRNVGKPGGLSEEDPTDPKYKQLAQESLTKYTEDRGIDASSLRIERIDKVTTQVVAGSMTRIDFLVTGGEVAFNCHSEIWERSWLNKKDINVTCQNVNGRVKRNVGKPGGLSEEDPTDPKYKQLAQESLTKYTEDRGIDASSLRIERIDKVTTQVVAGSMTRIDFLVTGGEVAFNCHSEIWERSWLNKKEISVTCQNVNGRVERNVGKPGGLSEEDPTDPKYKQLAQESLTKYTEDRGIDASSLRIERLDKVTTQVVAGSMTRIDFLVTGGEVAFNCHSEIWERSWLNKKEINVICQNVNGRVKRNVGKPGGLSEEDPTDPKYKQLAQESLTKYTEDRGIDASSLRIERIDKVTTQVVAGSMTRIDFLVTDGEVAFNCHSEIWERSWLNKKEISVTCQNVNGRVERNVGKPGGLSEEDPTDPKYKQLAQESLTKYTEDRGIDASSLRIERIDKVTTQVVAGSMTRIDFLVTGGEVAFNCHSEIWERSWLNKKEINVICQNVNGRVKRNVGKPGGLSEEDPTDPKYKQLAQESLTKYTEDRGIDASSLRIERIDKVTTQVVAGSMTRIDFLVTGGEVAFNCHSEIWERSWLNKKEISVTCQNVNGRVERNVGKPGGLSEEDPTDPKYKQLAQESLTKYTEDRGIDASSLRIERIDKVTTQVVAGSMTRIDFLVTGGEVAFNCHSEIWERSWLNKKEINVTCQNVNGRVKKNVGKPGGLSEKDPTDPKYKQLAQESLTKYTEDRGIDASSLRIERIDKVTTQVVAGSMTRIDFLVTGGEVAFNCHSEIWERAWLGDKKIDITCYKENERIKRDVPILGGVSKEDPSDPKFKILAEEALNKYALDNGVDSASLKIDRIDKVTTQVVAGTLTTLDFFLFGEQNESTIKCHSKIWERGWLGEKDIKISCQNVRLKRDLIAGGLMEQNPSDSKYKALAGELKGLRLKREIGGHKIYGKENITSGNSSNSGTPSGGLRGGVEEEKDPNKKEFRLLAEDALKKFQRKSFVLHQLIEVKRVVSRVVAGFKYEIDFTAAPTDCTVNVSKILLPSCELIELMLLNCHAEIWERPWLKQKKIDVDCEAPDTDFEDDDLDFNEINVPRTAPAVDKKNHKGYLLAEEATDQYLTSSNRKYVHKVTELYNVVEYLADGSITKLEFSISPTNCLRNETRSSNDICKIKTPLTAFHCNAKIWDRPWLNTKKNITVHCKKMQKVKKLKRDLGVKSKRQIGDVDDDLDEEATFYYADRAVQSLNDGSNSNNLHKLISIHAADTKMQMNNLMVRMYIEVAETYCLRNRKETNLHECAEMSGLNHRLCLARIWPSPDDELVIRHVAVVCDDDDQFFSVTGLNILELLKWSIRQLESDPDNHFKLIHQGEPQVIPTLDVKNPLKLNFIVATTNCSKDVDLTKNPYQCFHNTAVPSRACHSFIWLAPEKREIRYIIAKCPTVRSRRSLSSTNTTKSNVEIQSMVTEALEKLEMESSHRYKQRILQINSHSTKITSGRVTTIDFDVGYTSCLKYEWVENIATCDFIEHLPRRRCVAQVWERLWINNGRRIDVNCVDDETPLESHIEFESAEMANQLSREALKHIEAKYPHPKKQRIVRVFSLEKQLVAGIHYRMKVEVGLTDCLALSEETNCKLVKDHHSNKFCRINVWVRPWVDHPPNFRVVCDFQEGATHELYHHVQAEILFYNFITTYNPVYANDYTQMHKRFEIFKANIKKIHELNVHEKGTARYGVTRFTDLTYEEFSSTYMGLNTSMRDLNQIPMKKAEIPDLHIPDSFDWREFDAVTEVKDQGSCGSCWAFSVTGNIEGQWKMQSGQLVSLSEQELVDCDKLDDGCNGGLPDNAYRAIEQLGGLETEMDYPYEGEGDKCEFNKTIAKVQISGAVNITSNETAMAQWLVHNGPISIGINANAMQFYMGGISHPWKMLCNPTNLDHGVLIVGYGVKEYPLFHKTLPYWIIKNSWGKSWGEQGYYRVYRGDGTCGVNQMASSAVI